MYLSLPESVPVQCFRLFKKKRSSSLIPIFQRTKTAKKNPTGSCPAWERFVQKGKTRLYCLMF